MNWIASFSRINCAGWSPVCRIVYRLLPPTCAASRHLHRFSDDVQAKHSHLRRRERIRIMMLKTILTRLEKGQSPRFDFLMASGQQLGMYAVVWGDYTSEPIRRAASFPSRPHHTKASRTTSGYGLVQLLKGMKSHELCRSLEWHHGSVSRPDAASRRLPTHRLPSSQAYPILMSDAPTSGNGCALRFI